MNPAPDSPAGTADKEPVRYGIRFLLALTAVLLASLTIGLTAYAYLALDQLQTRMAELGEGNLEEITLAGRLRDATEPLLRPLGLMAELPAESINPATLSSARQQLDEVRDTADELSARLKTRGSPDDRERMRQARQGLAATEAALEQFTAAAARHGAAQKARRDIQGRLEAQFERLFEDAAAMEGRMRTLVAHALAADLPEAAGQGQLQSRLEGVLEREMSWLGTAQNLRSDSRELLAMLRALGRESEPARLAEGQRQAEAYANRLAAWRRLPESDEVKSLGRISDALVATVAAARLPQARAEEIAAETALGAAARHTAAAARRFAEQADEVALGLGRDAREGIRQTHREVKRMQATLAIAAVVTSLCGALLIFGLVARRIVRPLERITSAMRSAAAGLAAARHDWQAALAPPPASGNDEVAAMYRALGIFRDKLVRREEESERSQAQLRTILMSVDQAIQLWDSAGRLVYSNAMAIHLLGAGPDAGDGHWRYLREDGSPLAAPDFPQAVALRTRSAQNGVIMQAVNPAGIARWLQVNAQPVKGAEGDGILGVVVSCTDVSEFKEQQAELQHLAHHDPLTQLPNRMLLEDRLEHAISQADRNGTLLAVCYLDLDGFKPVNDQYGHAAGDLLLQEISHRLKANLRGGDTVARLGGDEFVLLLAAIDDIPECQRTLKRVLQSISDPCTLSPDPQACAHVTASIGVTIYPIDHSDSQGLLRHADHAMYLAKQAGKNTFHIYTPEAPGHAVRH